MKSGCFGLIIIILRYKYLDNKLDFMYNLFRLNFNFKQQGKYHEKVNINDSGKYKASF